MARRKVEPVIAVMSSDTHIQELAWANYPRLAWDALLSYHFLVELSNKYAVPLLLAGDIMDKRVNSPEVTNRFLQALGRAEQPLLFIRGDHDGPPPGWPEALGSAADASFSVHELRPENPIELEPGIRVTGLSWMPEPELLQRLPEVSNSQIVLLHQGLVEIADFETVLSIKDLPAGPSMFVVGHIHKPAALSNPRGQRIVSPGGTNAQSIVESDEKYAYLLRRDLSVLRVAIPTRRILRVNLVGGDQVDSALSEAVATCRDILDGAKDSARAKYLEFLPGQTPESIVRPIVQVTYQVTIPGVSEKISARLRGLCHLFTKPVDVGQASPGTIGQIRTAGILGEPLRAVFRELENVVSREHQPQLHSDCLTLLESLETPKDVLLSLRRSAWTEEEHQ